MLCALGMAAPFGGQAGSAAKGVSGGRAGVVDSEPLATFWSLSTGDTFGTSYEPLQWLTPDQELSQTGDLLKKAILTGRQLVRGAQNVEPHGDTA